MKKRRLLILLIVLLSLLVYFIVNSIQRSTENHKLINSMSFKSVNNMEIVGTLVSGVGNHNFSNQDHEVLGNIVEYVANVFTNLSPNIKAESATFDYLKLRLEALYTPDRKQLAQNYQHAYYAMGCVFFLMRGAESGISPEELISSVNQKFLSDPEFKKQQERVDAQLNGEIFIDLPLAEKERFCNEKYK